MSGLTGFWNLDNSPGDRAIAASMAGTLTHRGEDAEIWCQDALCLAARVRRVTPESLHERQPLADARGHVLVFDGRLDNRDDILRTLKSERPAFDVSDPELVLSAWREWGEGCLSQLNGEFALALFDPRDGSLTLARDPVGCRGLYYWIGPRAVVFGSEIKSVIAHPDVSAKPNEELIADFFLLVQLPYEDEGETFFSGVHAVLPGCSVRVTTAGLTRSRFWDFDPAARLRYRTYDAYAEELRGLMTQAVRRRLRSTSPVAISVSGGLDSSIVLCLADDLRRSGASGASLVPLTYAPADNPDTEENRFIRMLEQTRGLQIERLPMGEPGDVEQLESAAWHSECPFFDRGWCMEAPLLARARSHGASTLLMGLWSDQFMFGMGYLSDLFRQLAWRDLAQHLREYRKWFVDVRPSYFASGFVREMVLNLTPATLRSQARRLRTMALKAPHHALTATMESRARRARPPLRHPPYATAHARNIYQGIRRKSHRLQFEAEGKVASGCGLERLTPFLDRDVIAFLMSIPGEVQTRNGVPRALLRDAMRGIVPDVILRRRWPDEGTTAEALDRIDRQAYLAMNVDLAASRALGFSRDASPLDDETLELIGLEFWSRLFFSGRLGAHRKAVFQRGGST